MSDIRRLPVYLVIDCSESMAGPALDAVQNGLEILLNELRGDPSALETVWLSLITFSNRAKVITPLTDICEFQRPKLILGSGTSLGVALDLLAERLKAEIIVQTAQRKGDWKPIVFIMTDGNPTDTWFTAADNFKTKITGKKANVIVVACGPDVDISNLKRISPTVLAFKNPNEPSFKEFFRWVSQSVNTTSARCTTGQEASDALPRIPPTMEIAADGLQVPMQSHVFLLCRCAQTKGIYVARFDRIPEEALGDLRQTELVDLSKNREYFCGAASHPVTDFELDAPTETFKLSVPSDSLLGLPACPHCGSEFLAMCASCQRLLCVREAGNQRCPWCGSTGSYEKTERSFEVGRGLG